MDAKLSGRPLNAHQKEIVLVHEIGHYLRGFALHNNESSFSRSETREILNIIDLKKLREFYKHSENIEEDINYIYSPEEIVERLSQILNYFGIRAGEKVTSEHFEYAKRLYIPQTDLDNNMTEFFMVLNIPAAVKFCNEYLV